MGCLGASVIICSSSMILGLGIGLGLIGLCAFVGDLWAISRCTEAGGRYERRRSRADVLGGVREMSVCGAIVMRRVFRSGEYPFAGKVLFRAIHSVAVLGFVLSLLWLLGLIDVVLLLLRGILISRVNAKNLDLSSGERMPNLE